MGMLLKISSDPIGAFKMGMGGDRNNWTVPQKRIWVDMKKRKKRKKRLMHLFSVKVGLGGQKKKLITLHPNAMLHQKDRVLT